MEEKTKTETNIKIIDIDNRIYMTTGEKIGQGGQGAVYRIENDNDIAVKIITNDDGEPLKDLDTIKSVSEKLNQIRLLPIPQNINLSKPLAVLKSHAGYVMTFMNGMKSFEYFLKLKGEIKEGEVPAWLKPDGKPIPDVEIWVNYCKTGGLRTRLLALYKISELLASLHANGLVYGDISGGNLMFKDEENKITAGLIDADNINFAGKSKTYYTCGYGAPEIVTGQSYATMFSDAYSFAVAAFYIITMMHPFKGSKVLGEENEDDDWAKSVVSQKKADPGNFNDDGSYPWIFDSDDDSNAYGSQEQVIKLFLSPTLFALFDNTFAAGHINSKLRTPLSRWSSAFAEAADTTIKCSECGMTYYYDNEEDGKNCCPYCSNKREKVLVVRRKSINSEECRYMFVHELAEDEIFLPSRCFEPFRIRKSDEYVVGVKCENGMIELRSLNDDNIVVSKNNEAERILVGRVQYNISDVENWAVCLKYNRNHDCMVILTVE